MKRLRELRLQLGLTTTELGQAIGCSNPTITNYELGNRNPDPETLMKLADYFNVSVDYLLDRTKTPNSNLEWTDEDKALGVGNHPEFYSEEEKEWMDLRSEIIEAHGKDQLNTIKTLLKAWAKQKN